MNDINDINDIIKVCFEKAMEEVSKDYEERIKPFIEKARQSIKHPHFYYAEVDTDNLTVEYKRKKWYQWFSGKRIVKVKIKKLKAPGLPIY